MKKKFSPSSEQIIIRLGKGCNFKCTFCNVGDNEQKIKIKESYIDILAKLNYKIYHSSIKKGDTVNFTISGGEPTLFKKELLFSLKCIKELAVKKGIIPNIDIQTNGYNIDLEYANILHKLGIDRAMVSFHTVNKESYEKIIGVPYEYLDSVIDGINNLNSAGIEVYLNVIINSINISDFLDTVDFINEKFPFISEVNIGIIQPHGNAYTNFDSLYISYEYVYRIYNKAIAKLFSAGKTPISHYVGLPVCYLDTKRSSVEYSQNISYRKKMLSSKKHFLNSVNDLNKIQTSDCNKCLYNNICSGIWEEYVGIQKLKPINRIIDFFNSFEINDFAYKLKTNNENLKKIYDKDIRQIIVNSSLISNNLELIKEISNFAFYDISLFIDNEKDILKNPDLFTSGITNIQINIKDLDVDFLEKLLDFSKSFSPQFRIDLDIFINDYSQENFRKLEQIKLNLPNNFISLFFIYNSTNKEIYKYNDFLLNSNIYKDNIFTVNYNKDFSYNKSI